MENLKNTSAFETASKLGEFWHEKKVTLPTNLKDRIEFAMNLSKRELSENHRQLISSLIRELASHGMSSVIEGEEFDMFLSEFEKGKIALSDVFGYEIDLLQNQDLAPEIQQKIGDINQMVYGVLKGVLDGTLRADALTSLDKVIDENRNATLEVAVRAILKKIGNILVDLGNLKSVNLAHVHPDPDNNEYVVYTSDENEKAEIDCKEMLNLTWQKAEYEDLMVDYARIKSKNEAATQLIFKLSFGDQEIGYLVYEFEGDNVHPLTFGSCANMSAMLDTFLNARLQNEIKEIIADRKREILEKYKFKEWRKMCSELCSTLSKVLGTRIAFTCDAKPGSKNYWYVMVDGDNVDENANFLEFTHDATDAGGEFFAVNIDEGEGRKKIGSLMVACKDDAQRGIVNDALSFIESILMGREEARHWLSKLIGAPSADKWLENDIEEVPTAHPVVTLFSDIDDYSRTVHELSDAKTGIGKIMSEFISRVKLEIERDYGVVIDKFVGDEVIVLIGPPYGKNGLDMFGNKEPNYAQYIDLAYTISQELQRILDEISEEIQERDRFELPRRLVFANGCGLVDGDPVGIYGAPEKPGAGVDYTIFGDEMNKIARVLGKADANQFLMPNSSYKKYVGSGGSRLQPVGEAFMADTKGVGQVELILVHDSTNPLVGIA
ncbi:hypothetical protein KKD70_02990 [Patescibacteria group bacterium]|nr:hypothetical protein [Patescibacteria group bacterium]